MSDRIFQTEDGMWTFWDETDDRFGLKFTTRERAATALMLYVEYIDTGEANKEQWDALEGVIDATPES